VSSLRPNPPIAVVIMAQGAHIIGG
jgi:hypothetical protein